MTISRRQKKKRGQENTADGGREGIYYEEDVRKRYQLENGS
jgi:hypothetical protein